jgi:hypothetical protein
VNDSLRVRGVESVGDLNRNFQQFGHSERLSYDAMLEGHALHQLHREEGVAIVLADLVNGADVGMIQGGSGTGFAPEALEGLTVIGDIVGQEFQRDVAAKIFVFGLIDHTHPAATEFLENAIVRNFSPRERGRFGHWREYYVAPSHKSRVSATG